MNIIYRGLMTLEACSWMLVVYTIKAGQPVLSICPWWLFAVILAVLSFILSALTVVKMPALLERETDLTKCRECRQADGDFLPIYLGFFFVALSIQGWTVMLIVFVIVCAFTFLANTQLFNPLLLVFGYHYYNIVTQNGSVAFVITRQQELRNAEQIHLCHLRRISNTTYIEYRERK